MRAVTGVESCEPERNAVNLLLGSDIRIVSETLLQQR